MRWIVFAGVLLNKGIIFGSILIVVAVPAILCCLPRRRWTYFVVRKGACLRVDVRILFLWAEWRARYIICLRVWHVVLATIGCCRWSQSFLNAPLCWRHHGFIDYLVVVIRWADCLKFVRTRCLLNHRSLQLFHSRGYSWCRETWDNHRIVSLIKSLIFEKTFRLCSKSRCFDQLLSLLFGAFLMSFGIWLIGHVSVLWDIRRASRTDIWIIWIGV